MSGFNRKLLYFVLLYTCVEGLVVNMTFPSKVGFVIKDVVLIVAAGLLLADNGGQRFGSLARLAVPLGLFAVVQAAYMVMPIGDLPFMAKLVGLKMRLLYIFMMLLGYRFVRTPQDVYQLLAVLLVAAIPVSLFGIYLYFAGPTALQAMGGTYSAVISSTTGFWRVPGTFNSPGQYGLYLTFNSLIAIALLLVPGLTLRTRLLFWGSLAVMTLAALVCGSRTPLILTLAGGAMILIGMGAMSRLVSMAAGVYIILALGFTMFGAGVEERVGSIASMGHVERFNQTYFGQMFIPKLMETPMGLGLGAATIGARHFSEFREIILVESYLGVVAVETGLLGLAVLLVAFAGILAFLLKTRALMRKTAVSSIWHALAAFVFIIALLSPVGTALDAAPANVYFWLALGIGAKLYDLQRQTYAARMAEAASPYRA